jgi:hypothetical protein
MTLSRLFYFFLNIRQRKDIIKICTMPVTPPVVGAGTMVGWCGQVTCVFRVSRLMELTMDSYSSPFSSVAPSQAFSSTGTPPLSPLM